ncbi:PAS fold-containing protein [Halogranum rubrum]|uniref:histidine kinase n=1 Tax=Halogranum rubrum TaxID=553466 RepID=A0A1I4BWF0_9EURY|nr:PAS fold-containing protein [Halogranum rubrum]
MFESTAGVVVVIERERESAAEALTELADDARVESVSESSAFATFVESSDEAVDCVVVGDGTTALSTVVDDVRDVAADVPLVAFRPATTTPPGAALDAGVTDVVPSDGPDATRLLVRRVEREVSHRRREREHAETANLLDTLFEQIPLHLYVKDTDGRHLRVSRAYTDDPEQYVGKTDVELAGSEESRQTYADDMRVIEENEPILYKREPLVREVGDRFSVDDLQRHYSETRPDVEALNGETVDDERYEGWVLTSKVPWRDVDGDVVGLIGVTIDVSQQEAYRRLLERQNTRLEEFASVVAHDIRNPLNVAAGYIELTRETGNLDHLQRVVAAHGRIADLVDDVLTLARGGNDIKQVSLVSLDALVTEAWETVDSETQAATLSIDGPLGSIRADKTRMLALLENLFSNAVEHGVRDTAATTGDAHVNVRVGRLPNGFYVEDDGPGIPDDVRERLFEQGVTTTPDGTGFGLAIVQRVAEAHGWDVDVVDATDGATTSGARFEIRE